MREITRGSGRSSRSLVEGLTAEMFNAHYASISTDCDYRAPSPKQTAQLQNQYITEMDVFRTLDRLRPKATGVDEIPAWFLRLGAPFFAAPLTHLLNQSTTEATAVITPIQKVTKPMQPAGLFLLLLFSRAHWKDSLSDLTFKLLSSPPPGLICKGARILLPYNGFPKQNATNESYLEYRR